MKIGILKADSVLAQFQPSHGDYPDMFIQRLRANSPSELAFGVYDVEHGVYPNDIDECDAYIITGSKKSVYDDDEWIQALGRYVVALHNHKKPLAGICFGHQLVAQSLGGKTQPAEVGWGVGVHESTVVQSQPYMSPGLASTKVLVSHKDQVTQLPQGATLLASSDFCPNSMYQIEDHIFCMQGHPEFEPAYSQDLITMRKEILGEAVFTSGVDSLATKQDSDVIARWILNFLQAARKFVTQP